MQTGANWILCCSLGDLVDQAFHGWASEVNLDENNFKEFIDIITGRGNEVPVRQNEGLKVALFTTTGNHDWRLHPYDPALGRFKTFGLTESEAKNYPYLDYAFTYGNNHFILMDSGSDAFIGKLLDRKERGHLKKVGITDNSIGGSPDSRAFDSEHLYYNWSQIVWLEKVLHAKVVGEDDHVFIGIHAPPVNVPDELYKDLQRWQKVYRKFYKLTHPSNIYNRITSWNEIHESYPEKKNGEDWISKKELNLAYGTINHYVSQFFYLCLGLTEAQNKHRLPRQFGKRVTMVLSGHAHRNIEFSIDIAANPARNENEVRIFSDLYSEPPDVLSDDWKRRPLVVQTAACGPTGSAKNPPYYRKIEIREGELIGFEVQQGKQN